MSYSYYQYDAWRSVSRPGITWAVQRLILANSLVFAGQLAANVFLGAPLGLRGALTTPGGVVTALLAFEPAYFLRGFLWMPFTYMFLHSGLLHLFMNMLWLFFFGPDVERVLGTRQFLRFYVICGAIGVLATLIPNSRSLVLGASGAVMGVLVAYAVINPQQEFFLFPFPVPVTARAVVFIVIILNIFTALTGSGRTSVATHFGGMAAGFAYMKLTPFFLRRRNQRDAHKAKSEDSWDATGKAVDNIFKFEDEKHRRRQS